MEAHIPTLRWPEFQRMFMHNWKQSEHVVIIGATGSGKTRLLREIIPNRTFTVVFATKPYDESMDEIAAEDGYVTCTQWPINASPFAFPKRILWPDAKRIDSVKTYQKPVFQIAFDFIYTVGGWTVVLDELWFFVNVLKFGSIIKLYLTQARSMYITLVQCAQRTAWVPVEVFNQSTHHFYFAENDERNLNTISSIAYKIRNELKDTISNLPRHHFLYFNKATGYCCVSAVT